MNIFFMEYYINNVNIFIQSIPVGIASSFTWENFFTDSSSAQLFYLLYVEYWILNFAFIVSKLWAYTSHMS